MDKISSIEVNPDGQLELNWVLKDKAPKSVYDIYLMEVDENDEIYQFTDQAVFNSPLKSEELEVDPKISPSKKGNLLDSVKDLHFVLADTIDTKRLYALQIVEKTRRQPLLAKVILLQANFELNSEAKGTVAGDKILLEWKPVPGANRYEVYADETMGVLLGKSDTNELELETFGKPPFKNYYVRALRGVLAAKDVIRISLNQSSAKILRVSALSPDGLYSPGQTLDFVVEFSEPVTVYGESFLPLKTQNQIRKASYLSGTSTKSVTFRYTVAAGDDTADLDTEASLLGSYLDGAGLDVSQALPAPGQGLTLKELSSIAIDTIKPTSPASVGFSNTLSANGNFDLHWAQSEDLHFLQHNVKLCSDMACETSCGPEASSADTMLSFSGISQGIYYGCVQGEDLVGLKSAWAASLTPIAVDTSPPSVVRVYSQSANGTFKETQTVTLAVEFDEAVLVSGNDAFLTLAAGPTDRNAVYSSGSGSTTLIFTYTVQAGDESSDLNYKDIHSLNAGTGTLRDAAAHDALLTLAPLPSAASLAGQSAIVIDTTNPLPPSAVSFSGATSLSSSFPMSWTSGSDANLKQHNVKLCALNDCTSSCSNVETATTSPHTMSVASDGSYYGCVQSEDQVGHLSLWIPSSAAIQVDSVAPTVVRVTAASGTLDAVYKEGDVIDLSVLFSENVLVSNGAEIKLALETGATDRQADYLSGSGGSVLVFRYTAQSGDFSADLNYLDTSALTVGAGSIRDASTHDAILTLPALASVDSLANQQALVIDTAAPSDPSGIAFQNPVSNTTNLVINWTASSEPHFSHYNVKVCSASDCSTSCSSVVTTTLLSSTQTGVDGSSYYACVQAEDLYAHKSPWIASADAGSIDTSAPFISSVSSSSSDGYYKTGDTILIPVTFSEAVTVTQGQDLSLLLETGTPDRNASYVTGSGTDTLVFSYTVQAGDNSSDLEFESTGALSLGASGAIKDSGGTPAVLTLPALQSANSIAGQKAIVIDTTLPTLPTTPGFSSPVGNSLSFDLSWGESTDANFSTHEVKLCTANDCSTGCISDGTSLASPVQVTGASGGIYYGCVRGVDLAGLNSNWVSSLATMTIDTGAPTILSVSSSLADGAFKEGASIPLLVTFSEAVEVTHDADLALKLETGSSDRNAVYTSGSGSATLVFTYTVEAGDSSADLDIHSTGALTLGSSGTIRDLAGNDATLTLPAPASSNSLAGQKTLVIDTSAPAAPVVTSPADGDYLTSALTTISGTSEADASIDVKNGSTIIGTTVASGSSWSITLSSSLLDGTYPLSAIATDAAGNASVASAVNTVIVDTSAPNPPVISSLSTPTSDATPTVSGTSEAAATIKVYADAVLVGTTTADGSGNWSLDTSSLADQDYTITATATDAGSRTSAESSGVPLNVDTTAPSAPSAVVFAGPVSGTTSIAVSWSESTDVNFLQHKLKLCSASDCTTNCIADTNSVASPASLLGVDGESYYACVQGEDTLGHQSAWFASASTVTVDATGATISNVSASTADGYYKEGDLISLSIEFTKNIIVDHGPDMGLLLETGTNDRVATYVSGSGSSTLIFSYTVQAGDTSSDLEYAATNALTLGAAGSLKDGVGNDAILALPPLHSSNSIAGQKAIVIDTTNPADPGSPGFASTLSNATSFDLSWAESSDTNFSTHKLKICTDSACSLGCISDTTSATSPATLTGVNGVTYYGCVQGEDKAGLTSAWVGSLGTLTVDTTVPTVVSISSAEADGAYKAGSIIPISVVFSEVVNVVNGSDLGLQLETGTTDRTIPYTSGSGSTTLLFTYTVQAGDTSADLEVLSQSALGLGASGAIQDLAGSNSNLTLPVLGDPTSLSGQKNLVIDTSAPAAPSILVPAANAYLTSDLTIISGTSEADATIEIKSNGTVVGTTTAVGSSWSLTLTTPLSDGIYSLTAIASDAAGNASSASAANSVTVDTSDPDAPLIAALTTPSNDSEPNVSGTSEAGMTIKVYADGVLVGTTTADGLGNWTLETSTLSDQAYTMTATATDPGSRTSAASAGVPLTIDTTPPSAPSAVVFDAPISNSTSLGLSWTNSTDVNFRYHNVKLCTANTCASGCIAEITSVSTPATLSGVDGTSYYACVQGEDLLGQKSNWIASTATATIDTSFPTVSNVSSSATDGYYKVGDTLDINVQFSEAVTVSNESDLGLTLDTGVVDRTASYVSGSGTNTLVFRYTVQADDTSADLDYASTSALSKGASGTIRDSAGNDATLTLPPLAGALSIAGQKSIVIDTTAPSNPSNLTFASTTSNSATFNLSWTASSDTNFSTHNLKICAASDCSTGCTSASTAATSPQAMTGVDDATYYGCAQGLDLAGQTSSWIPSSGTITIDTTVPSISDVNATNTDGYYKAGDTIDITVLASEVVYVQNGGDLGLLLETGTTDRTAVFTGGSGTNTLTFTYTVQAGDTSADLDIQSVAALTLGATGSIKDNAGNGINLTLPALGGSHSIAGQKALIIDTTPPTLPTAVSFGSSTSTSTSLNLSWTNSSDTNFSTHNVKLCGASDCSTSCSAVTTSTASPLTLSGVDGSSYYACVQGLDAAGQTSSWVPSGGSITVDTSIPTVTSVSSTLGDGYYKTGDVIPISVLFSESVTVTTPAQLGLLLETGTTDRTAVYSSGSGTNTLIFNYTVQSGDISSDLNYPDTTALTVGTGAIKDSAGNSANLALPALASANSLATQKALVIDTTPPSNPSNVTFPDAYSTSATVSVSFTGGSDTNFSLHSVRLCTNIDCTTGCVASRSGSSSPIDSSSATNGVSYYACVRTRDLALNDSAWIPSASQVTIDTALPTVLSVSSSQSNGSYKVGVTIPITVQFSETVFVTNPSDLGLLLETGTTDRTASYSSGSGTATLTFTYTVAAGDTSSDLNYESLSALTLGSSGTIRDAAGNDANLALPTLAGTSSLAGQKALVIDTTPPADPSSVGFASAYVNSTTFSMSWSNSTDTNFNLHNTKICTSNTCASGCTSASTSVSSPKSVTGVNGVTYYGCVQGVDTAGNSTGFIASLASVTIDTTAPTSPTISIASGDTYTTSISNSLTLSASGADEMYVTNTSGCATGGTWENYSTLKTWSLGQTNNTATVYVRFRDFAGNMTSCVNDTIIHDSTAPTSTGISINGGAASTTTTAVTLTLSATDANAIERYVTNTAGCASGGSWESFSTSKSWTLGQTGGTATVYVKYRDAAGNTSSCINDTITHLNPPIPSGTSVSINSGAASTNSTSVTLTLAATNATDVYITNAAGCNSGGSWVSYATSKSWVLSLDSSSTAAVYVKYRNTAVSESSCISDTISFAPTNLASNGDFELGNLTGWSVDTAGKWLVDNSSPLQGSYSAHTANLSDGDIECIYRTINLTSSSVDVEVTFTWAYLTEAWYDYGNFEVDGYEILWDSGEEAGRTFKRIVSKGANRELAWCFYKDNDYSPPGEFVKVDDIKVIALSLRPPTAVTATGLNQKVTLNIEAPVGSQTGYMVVRGSSAMPVFAPVNGTSYSTGTQGSDEIVYKGTSLAPSDTGLTNGQNYYYAVYSYDANNNYSLPTTVTAKPFAVHTPASLTASTASTQSNLSWTATAGGTGTGYLLVRNTGSPVTFTPTSGTTYSTGSVSGGQVVYVGSSSSYNNTGLTNGTRYYYSVWAYDASRNYSLYAASTMAYPTNVFAIFYQDSNYNGTAVSLPPGSYTTAQMTAAGIGDESISSLKVPSGWTVTMYKNEDFTGKSWYFTTDATGVPAGANDQTSSIIITAP